MTQPVPTTPPPPGDPAPAPTAPPAPPTTPPPPGDPAPDDKPLGPAGERALAAERKARQDLERQVATLAPLQKIAAALGAGTPAAEGKSEAELLSDRLAAHERELATERQARWRAEVAAESGLPAALVSRLQGNTREELAADATALLAIIPATPATPRTPAPDLSQGARGGQPADLDSQIREAQTKGDWKTVIRLQNQKLTTK